MNEVIFWLDGLEYGCPLAWMAKQMEARKALGMRVNDAALDSMRKWVELQAAKGCVA